MISTPFVQNRVGIILGLSPQKVNEIFCSSPGRLHGSPLRRAACAMLTVASSEPHVPLTLRRPGVMHVVLNNISNSFLGLKITGLKLMNLE